MNPDDLKDLSDELEAIKKKYTKQNNPAGTAREAGDNDTAIREGDCDERIKVMITSTKVTWEDIAGIDNAKKAINESVTFSKIKGRPDPWKGILLFGPPGTGKTMLAAATAGSFKATFFNVKISDILSKYFGESSKIISALYDCAWKRAPSIIFLDEIDSIVSIRNTEKSEASIRILSTLLSEMDGLHNKNSSRHIVTMGATNTPWDIDSAVLSRFQKRIYIPLPDPQAVMKMIKLYIHKHDLEFDGDMQEIAKSCVSKLFSGRDIATLCTEAHWNMWNELNKGIIDPISPIIRSLNNSDFKKALASINGTVTNQDVDKHVDWAKKNSSYFADKEQTTEALPFLEIVETENKEKNKSIKEKEKKEKEDDEKKAKEEQDRLKAQQEIKGMKFALIPAGNFMMGSNESDREKPVHKITISKAFYLGVYPVTQQEWKAVMKNNPSNFKGENLPVERVSWKDVQEFIKKLNEKEGTNKYRMPSEAEWEYAARAGKTTRYSFGEDESKLGIYAWYEENSGGKTHDVGQKKPNPWGLYDMHGNVQEWVQDSWHENYNGAPADGSSWESVDGSYRIIRGGSWNRSAGGCRSALRNHEKSDHPSNFLGFRLVRDL
ncbi:MAG: SUMF1/EgtB/PvdO family nonheme iron enzyme [Candidatus Methanoperedens sp.]|nr:SUMF1/EgtB/PvdO family nonheme iron enzyme [Candidatus Methanoperedens sp.]MCZ7369674.1 SUMF1/EgtB/PvdO family nonheme iron enzyme [Candidatus Methanoperedens sp.]